jgi:hypothetical protein
MKNTLLFFVGIAISLSACSQYSKSEASDEMSVEVPATNALTTTTQKQLVSTHVPDIYSNAKKIIKKANFRFQVDDVKNTTDALEQAIVDYNAYLETSDLKLDNPFLECRISVRVPNEFFHNLLKEIDKQATYVNFRNITTDDVSKDFVDLESRLKTKREVERRYIEILRSKAGTIEELLAAEQQIGQLHEEIEATVSRINYLKDQVTYSTINLEFYQTIEQKIAPVEEPGFITKAGAALTVGWSGVSDITLGLLHIWPLIILAGGGFYIFYRKRKLTISATART